MEINDFTTNEFQREFCYVIKQIIRLNTDKFIKDYFIKNLSKEKLLQLKEKEPSEILDKDKAKIIIESFINNHLEDIFKGVYERLDIDGTIDTSIFNKFDKEKIFDDCIEYLYDFLDYRELDVVSNLIDMGIIEERLINLDKIPELDDEIGDMTLLTDNIDYDTRESALVDIDGTILIGEHGSSHAQVLQKYINEVSNEEYQLEDEWYRPGDDEINKVLNPQYTAFGHVIDKDIIIEEHSLKDVTIGKVISDIDDSNISYDKIYEYIDNKITRVARLVK
jgi:hypothetical protein